MTRSVGYAVSCLFPVPVSRGDSDGLNKAGCAIVCPFARRFFADISEKRVSRFFNPSMFAPILRLFEGNLADNKDFRNVFQEQFSMLRKIIVGLACGILIFR